MMKQKISALSLVLALLVVAGCSKKESQKSIVALSAPTKPSTPPVIERKEDPPQYIYPNSDKRDPFVPLIGGNVYSSGSGLFNSQGFTQMELKGIFRERSGKVAYIVTGNGDSFFLKGGKIYDRKNRLISGISGTIKEESVVLISQNKVKELFLVKTSEAPK